MCPIDNNNPYDIFSENKKEELKTFADELLSMKGKFISMYIGDQAMNMNYDECSVPHNSIIYGKLIDILDRFVAIECFYLDNEKILHLGNKIYINTFQIRAMKEMDNKGNLGDVFLEARDAKKIMNIIREQKT